MTALLLETECDIALGGTCWSINDAESARSTSGLGVKTNPKKVWHGKKMRKAYTWNSSIWHTVQDIRAWRALMGNSTKLLGKPVMLNIHTPSGSRSVYGPCTTAGSPTEFALPSRQGDRKPRDVENTNSTLGNRRHEQANRVRTRRIWFNLSQE